MNNEQYRNLMWHLTYVESLLENVADANAFKGYCECPLCKSTFPAFFPGPTLLKPNLICPNCNSYPRHRALALFMQQMDWHRKGMRILHFAPEPGFYKLFSSFKDIDYWSVDLDPARYNGRVRKQVDIVT